MHAGGFGWLVARLPVAVLQLVQVGALIHPRDPIRERSTEVQPQWVVPGLQRLLELRDPVLELRVGEGQRGGDVLERSPWFVQVLHLHGAHIQLLNVDWDEGDGFQNLQADAMLPE